MLSHDKFKDKFIEHVERREAHNMSFYRENKKLFLCEEPLKFLHETDDVSNDKEKCRDFFEKRIRHFETVFIWRDKLQEMWFNTTENGINLRPGRDKTTEQTPAVAMGDDGVHGLIAGQTGSGKSVLLNNLIFNMLWEYAPWELDLYLVDFKRVEFSRYMNTYKTPHVCVCAATSEIRYVLSLISYLVDCMNAREEFFSRLGLTKIAEFRERYPDVVLPRMLLVVDEFQQLFSEASPREEEQVQQMLSSIVKKGRATGLHILFASQGLSQTLSRSVLANFRLRFALNCSMGVSMDIIGNRGATSISKGEVLYNNSGGSEENNRTFDVPFIEIDEEGDTDSYFYKYLQVMEYNAEVFHYHKVQKFYKEEMQESIEKLQEILKNDQVKEERSNFLRENQKYFEILTLGSYVTYSNLQYDIQTLFLEYGRNKNILAVSSKSEDLIYLERLLELNFETSPRRELIGADYHHEVFSFQTMTEGVAISGSVVHTNLDEVAELESVFARKQMLYELFKECHTPYEFAVGNYRKNLNRQKNGFSRREQADMEEQASSILGQLFGKISMDDIPDVCAKIEGGDYSAEEKVIAGNLLSFYRYRKDPYTVFPPSVYWFIGMDALERIPEWLLQAMKNGMNYNILFIIMASTEFDQMGQVAKCCDYFFAGGADQRIYDRLQMNYTHRRADSIFLDLNIKSMGEERSFKKYKWKYEHKKAPRIDFDKIFGAGRQD